MIHDVLSASTAALLTTILLIGGLDGVLAQVRSSSNYQLQSDSLNLGGLRSTSTNYVQESTVGEMATGRSTSTNFQLRAGYQQLQEIYLSLNTTGGVDMTPDLAGLTGGTSNGSTTVTVLTDNPAGYELVIRASTSPAMIRVDGSESIADYSPVGAEPDLNFEFAATEARFGFSPEGVDITSRFRDDTNDCGVGSLDSHLTCWDGLSTSDAVIARSTDSNHPAGATTTIHFRVGIGGNAGVIAGAYAATSTVTALPL